MKKNKIISLVLAIVLCLTATVLVVTANTKEASIQIASDKTELKAGESATVSVNVTTNFSVATMSIPVFYDKTMVTVSDATANLTDYSVKSTTTDAQSVNSDKVYADTNVDSSKYGFVLVTYIASAGTDVAETVDGAVLTFNVTALADVEGDAIINCVAESSKTTENVDGMLYFGSPASGKTINSVPENVENINFDSASETVVISKATAVEPELILTEYGAEMGAIIDYDICVNSGDYAGAVYGVDTINGEALEDYYTTEAGHIAVVENENGVFSTGATIELYNDDDELIATYVFIYFGDVNGDESIDAADAGAAEAHDAWLEQIEEDSAAFYAADVETDGAVDAADVSMLEAHDGWIELLPGQAEIAANFVVVY